MPPNRSLLAFGLFIALAVLADWVRCDGNEQSAGLRMTKIVAAYVAAPANAGEKVVPKIKRIYLAGQKFARIEQIVDSRRTDAKVIIFNEPDIWISTSDSRRWQHRANGEHDLLTHVQIIPGAPTELSRLEFGGERTFFARSDVTSIEYRRIRSTDCEGREYRTGDYVVQLYCDSGNRPVELDVIRNRRLEFIVAYTSYEADLPFEPILFLPETQQNEEP